MDHFGILKLQYYCHKVKSVFPCKHFQCAFLSFYSYTVAVANSTFTVYILFQFFITLNQMCMSKTMFHDNMLQRDDNVKENTTNVHVSKCVTCL